MSCKSVLYTAMTVPVSVAAGGVVPLGAIVRRFGNAIRVDGNAITLLEPGYYAISVNMTVDPLAASAVTARVEENGVPVAGATVTATPAAIGDDTPLQIPSAVVRVYCNGTKTITVNLPVAATVNNAAVTVVKV